MTIRDTLGAMTQAISVRLDDEAIKALRALEASGMTRSEAIRTALVDASKRLRHREISPLKPRRSRPTKLTARRCARSQRSWSRCVRRGDVVRFKPSPRPGHEQQGARFAVVLQADALLPRSVVIVAPTSTSARPASFRPEIQVGRVSTRVLVEQVGAVDVQRLGRSAGHLTQEELWSVDEALLTVLGLD